MNARHKPPLGGSGREDGRRIFERRILPLGDELLRRAMRMTGNAADAEDLGQETLMKALQASSTIEDPARVRGWAHAIMQNTFASWCRGNARRSLVPIDPSAMDSMASRAPSGNAGLRFDLDRALSGLDAAFREAVLLCDVEGLSYAEASTEMGCPVGTLMSRLHRGRHHLRADLD